MPRHLILLDFITRTILGKVLLRHIWTTVVCTHGAIFTSNQVLEPVLVAARSKARVYGRWLVGIVDLNPAGGVDVFLV
jgi:hypothetical protein